MSSNSPGSNADENFGGPGSASGGISSKRPCSPSSDQSRTCSPSPGVRELPPHKKSKPIGKRNCPKLADLERIPRAIVELAMQDYCSKLPTECPFPNPAEEQILAGAALVRACESLELNIEDEATYVSLTLLDKIKTSIRNIGFFLPIPKKTAVVLSDTEGYQRILWYTEVFFGIPQ